MYGWRILLWVMTRNWTTRWPNRRARRRRTRSPWQRGLTARRTTIATDVILRGPKAGQAGNANLRGSGEAVFTAGIDVTASNVTINGIQLSGQDPIAGGFETGLRVSGENVSVRNNLFSGSTSNATAVSAGLTLAGIGTSVQDNAFVGYDYGIDAVGDSSASISGNFVNSLIGIFTESTLLVVSNNNFNDTLSDFYSNPDQSNDLTTQFLANNTVSSANDSRDVQIFPRVGGLNVTGHKFRRRFQRRSHRESQRWFYLSGNGG